MVEEWLVTCFLAPLPPPQSVVAGVRSETEVLQVPFPTVNCHSATE